MAQHNLLGRAGEEAAARYLVRKGYRLRHRNWHRSHLELDLVAEWLGEIVFVEVKTRHAEGLAAPSSAVDREKREHLRAAAAAYLACHGLNAPYRFDIIEVVGEHAPFSIRHIEDAFSPLAEPRRNGHSGQETFEP